MEYSKEQMDNIRIDAYKTILGDISSTDIKILAYFDNEIYYLNRNSGTIHSYSTSSFLVGVINFSDFEKEYYICNSNAGSGLNRVYEFINEPIELLYKYEDSFGVLCIMMYIPSSNRIHVEYLKESDFELYFTRDYTIDNFKLIS